VHLLVEGILIGQF